MDTKIAFDNTPNSFMIFKEKKLSNRNKKPDMAMHICNSSTWKAEVERSVQIWGGLVYIANTRQAWVTGQQQKETEGNALNLIEDIYKNPDDII